MTQRMLSPVDRRCASRLPVRYCEFGDGVIDVRVDGVVVRRGVATFFLREAPARWISVGLGSSSILRDFSRATGQVVEMAAGTRPGLYWRSGGHHFFDAESVGLGSYEAFLAVSRRLSRLGVELWPTPAVTLMQDFLARWYRVGVGCPSSLVRDLRTWNVGGAKGAARYGTLGAHRVLDIRSAYAWAARDALPCRFLGRSARLPPPGDDWFVRARVSLADDWLPILGMVSRTNRRVFYPLGEFEGVFHRQEVLEADELGYRITPLVYWRFTRAPVLRQFVDFWFDQRIQGGPEVARWVRRGLQGFIGQFEAAGYRDSIAFRGVDVRYRSSPYRSTVVQPQLPFAIQARARVRLFRHVRDCHSPVWDTDGFAVPDHAYVRGLGVSLGSLREQRKGVLAVVGVRAYHCGEPVHSGVQCPPTGLDEWRVWAKNQRRIPAYVTDRATLSDGQTRPWFAREIADGIAPDRAKVLRTRLDAL